MSGAESALGTKSEQTLLLPGGIIVRSGPWHPDGGSSATSAVAVEVGWFLGEEKADERRDERAVLTTVLDARTMTPLAAWKGEQKRE